MNNRNNYYFDSKNFYNLLNLTGMTRAELAKRVGITQASISHYITGQCSPSEKQINKICLVLGCKYDELKKLRHGSVPRVTVNPRPVQNNDCLVKDLLAMADDKNAAVIVRAIKKIMGE